MSAQPREIWFSRPLWLPIHWKGAVFYACVLPALFLGAGILLSVPPGWPAAVAFLVLMAVIAALNFFVISRSR